MWLPQTAQLPLTTSLQLPHMLSPVRFHLFLSLAISLLVHALPVQAIEYDPAECAGIAWTFLNPTIAVVPAKPTSADAITVCYHGGQYADYASIQLDGDQLTVTVLDNYVGWEPNPWIVLGQRVGPLAPGDYQLTVVLSGEPPSVGRGYPRTVASKVPLHVAAATTGSAGWVVEYYNRALDHYFMTPLVDEMATLDTGGLKGWQRTGYAFKASQTSTASPVCRFYMPPDLGDSHFYSASPAECAATANAFPGLHLETNSLFHAELPDTATGKCASGLQAVYRIWNRRADSNHRYTTDAYVRKTMASLGYLPEGYGANGAVMCAPK